MQITSVQELKELLLAYTIPVESYGTGAAKTLEHLLEEVVSGECELSIEDGQIIRSTDVVCLDLFKNGAVLVEVKQRFTADGRERERKLDSSTGEKMKWGEEPLVAAERLLKEEMPFACGYPITFTKVAVTGPEESQSYPGIRTRYRKHFYEVRVAEKDIFDLVVIEADKTAFYRWVVK